MLDIKILNKKFDHRSSCINLGACGFEDLDWNNVAHNASVYVTVSINDNLHVVCFDTANHNNFYFATCDTGLFTELNRMFEYGYDVTLLESIKKLDGDIDTTEKLRQVYEAYKEIQDLDIDDFFNDEEREAIICAFKQEVIDEGCEGYEATELAESLVYDAMGKNIANNP
jgi:hypothetical protein